MAGDETKREDRSCSQKVWRVILNNLLIILMIIAVIIGVALGLGLRDIWPPYEKRKIFFLKFPGDLLMNMLKMLILPLVVSSLISALATLDSRASGKMGLRSIVYYLSTTFVAVVLGIILVVSIQPGKKGSQIDKSGSAKKAHPIDSLMDLIRNCFPNNLITACFRKQVTEVDQFEVKPPVMTTTTANPNISTTMMPNYTEAASFFVDAPYVNGQAEGMNVLGLVVFSIFFGCILQTMGDKGKPLVDFFECLHHASMRLVTLVIWYSPIGIIFLIASKLVAMERPEDIFEQLAYYMATVLAGLAIHAFILLPLFYGIIVRKNPYRFMYNMLKAILTAWGTASSSATLPITMECLEENNHVDIRVVKFVTPIGATINMDGTALYEAVASIFIAQNIGVDLDIGQVIIVSLTSTAAAIGAAGIPQAGLVTMTIVLSAVGLPIEEITLILAIDWFLDRFRTAVNVLGDSYGAGIIEHLSRDDISAATAYALETGTNGNVTGNGSAAVENPTFIKDEYPTTKM
ncbi:excitatory amino acid transporter 3-like [Ylistrum balloti]|uniref:excitatory amino acid transporter 3-like n=1 Tax=Ylistrum balloti TaxID=509963 RepID=UPI002905C461|nr:excitatory amino acid transporter 3-like [Ylistrum balloti]